MSSTKSEHELRQYVKLLSSPGDVQRGSRGEWMIMEALCEALEKKNNDEKDNVGMVNILLERVLPKFISTL